MKKPLNRTLNTQIIKKVARTFCDNRSHQFPYIFNNQTPRKYTGPNTLDITKKELTQNLILAYNAFLEGLRDKDADFLKEICEKTFAKQIIKSFDKVEELKLTDGTETTIKELLHEVHLFITSDREHNQLKKFQQDVNFKSPFKSLMPQPDQLNELISIYKGENFEMTDKCVVRLKCNVSSNKILYEDTKIHDYENHSIIFECEVTSWKDVIATCHMESKGSLAFSLFSNMGKFKDSYEWKISDFDYFMNENKLI